MIEQDGIRARSGAWVRSKAEENDLRRYARTLSEHRWLILLTTLIAMVAAILYVETAKPVYQAEADVLVSAVSTTNDSVLNGLSLVTASSDPSRDVQTAAHVIVTNAVAQATLTKLALPGTPQQLLKRISVQPVAQSDIVALTAQAETATAAAALANAFAQEAITQRRLQFGVLLDAEITQLKVQLGHTPPPTAQTAAEQSRLAQLETLRSIPLPDMRVSTPAVAPSSRTSPRVKLSVGAGVIGGLVLGLVAAFALEVFDPRLRREDQLRDLFRLPVLTRVPREGGTRGLGHTLNRLPIIGRLVQRRRARNARPRLPEGLSPASLEAYRTLRARLLASRPDHRRTSRSILVTSASPSEGKTTSAINLAVSLAWSGASVILIEADLRRPSVGRALGLTARHDVSSVLVREVDVASALIESPTYGPNLRFLLAHDANEPNVLVGDGLFLPTAAAMLDEACSLADYVVVDSPPLAEVIDALAIARQVDDVLLVVRLNQTNLPRLAGLGELLARTNIEPAGIALIGTEPANGLNDVYGYLGSTSPPLPGSSHPLTRPQAVER